MQPGPDARHDAPRAPPQPGAGASDDSSTITRAPPGATSPPPGGAEESPWRKLTTTLAIVAAVMSAGCGDSGGGGGDGTDYSAGCVAANAALAACTTELDGDHDASTDQIDCTNQTAQTNAYYQCLADVYDGLDCTDAEAVAAMDTSGCAL